MTEQDGSPSIADGHGAQPAICPVCPHRNADHDAIARRFCAARIAGSSGSGCACGTEAGT